MCLVKEEYVGAGKSDHSISIRKICIQPQKNKQEIYTDGKLKFLIPEVLSNQLTTLATNLTETKEKAPI